MGKQGTLKSIIQVTISNVAIILSGIVVALLLPKLLPVSDYGWCKTFSLYTSYVGFCSLGLIDGIVLKHGGEDYQNMDKPLFRTYFKWYVLIHMIFLLAMIVAAFFFADINYSVISIAIGFYALMANLAGYYQQISQITRRFKEYSLRKLIYSGLKITNLGLLFLWYKMGHEATYMFYLLVFLLSEALITLWYVYTYREISFGSCYRFRESKGAIISLSKTGFPLLFANLCSTLILSLDRQFVSVLFDKNIYATYAFAYNMLALVTVAVSAISTVLYPTLKRTTEKTMKNNYGALVSIVTIFVFGSIISYFPLCVFVKWFLPKYVESLPIFRIVFPGLALSSAVTVVMHNYYKVLGKSFEFFKKCIVMLIVSALANAVAFCVFKTTTSISIASIISLFFWFFYVEHFFVKEYKYSGIKNSLYIITMMVSFYGCSHFSNYYLGLAIYLLCFVIVTLLINRKVVFVDLRGIIKRG